MRSKPRLRPAHYLQNLRHNLCIILNFDQRCVHHDSLTRHINPIQRPAANKPMKIRVITLVDVAGVTHTPLNTVAISCQQHIWLAFAPYLNDP